MVGILPSNQLSSTTKPMAFHLVVISFRLQGSHKTLLISILNFSREIPNTRTPFLVSFNNYFSLLLLPTYKISSWEIVKQFFLPQLLTFGTEPCQTPSPWSILQCQMLLTPKLSEIRSSSKYSM